MERGSWSCINKLLWALSLDVSSAALVVSRNASRRVAHIAYHADGPTDHHAPESLAHMPRIGASDPGTGTHCGISAPRGSASKRIGKQHNMASLQLGRAVRRKPGDSASGSIGEGPHLSAAPLQWLSFPHEKPNLSRPRVPTGGHRLSGRAMRVGALATDANVRSRRALQRGRYVDW